MEIMIVLVVLFTPIFIAIGMLWLLNHYLKKKNRSKPFTEGFLRSPGESILEKVEDLKADIFGDFFGLTTVPLMLYALYMTQLYYLKYEESLMHTSIIIIVIIGVIIYSLFKLYKHFVVIKKYRLGYEGEIAVGQKLNELMAVGYSVYHDLVAKNFNIDHIIVGNTGVYAVETKARRKADKDKTKYHHVVEYDGKNLKFPDWSESKPLDQAERQAKWLSNRLSSAIGNKVNVFPVVVIPGWYIKLTGKSRVVVVNEKQFTQMLKRPVVIGESQIIRIKHQLEQICRKDRPEE